MSVELPRPAMNLRILLADDHSMFRAGLRAVLDTQADFECVAEVSDGRAAVDEVIRLRPDVAILDIRMPRLDGLCATESILGRPDNATKVLVLTTYDSDAYVYRALQAGASGFLLKSLPPEELVAAVRVAARGDALIDPALTRRFIARFVDTMAPAHPSPGLDSLTAREHEVLVLLAQARSNSEIADELGIGDETVKSHVSRILAKLGLRDRTQAVVYANDHHVLATAPRSRAKGGRTVKKHRPR
ncbi:response regulator [Streptomyces sp. CWNU-52H]|uniref:response regulator n=1 Tax=Streptomyces sp. CWNU-52H TaxID=3394352 RepID=UPI0039BF973E